MRLRNLTERAGNTPQHMKARRTEARILETMPVGAWMSCTAVSRLIAEGDDRKTRARLNRLVRNGKIECRQGQGTHGLVYLFCKPF
jgi:hypothetical protein